MKTRARTQLERLGTTLSRTRLTSSRRNNSIAYLYVLPAVALYSLFFIWPMMESVWISFFRWDGFSASTWVGLENYASVLADEMIWEAFSHSLVFIVFYAFLPIVIALLLIGTIARIRVYGLTFLRAAIFVPYILSTVVVAISWRWIYTLDGPLNGLLTLLGAGDLARAWLGDFSTALPAVGLIGTWSLCGLAFVLFMSGVQKISPELFEAARLDGAGPFQEFFAVTLPSLRGELRVALILTVTAALRNFDIVWNTTRGGPGTSTNVPSYAIYLNAFVKHEVGVASAVAVILTVVILSLIGLMLGLIRDRKDT